MHSDERPYICSYPNCGKSFKRSRDQTSHHRSVHSGEKPHSCTYSGCERAFALPSNLDSHIRQVHLGEKKWECSICRKGFYTSSKLEAHMNTHTGKKPHACPKCGKGFAQHGNRRAHMLTHEEKPRKCRKCDGTFDPSSPEEHECTGIKTKPFKCPCGKGSTTSQNFRKHQRVCPPRKDICQDYICPYCGHACGDSGNLKGHIKNHPRENSQGGS